MDNNVDLWMAEGEETRVHQVNGKILIEKRALDGKYSYNIFLSSLACYDLLALILKYVDDRWIDLRILRDWKIIFHGEKPKANRKNIFGLLTRLKCYTVNLDDKSFQRVYVPMRMHSGFNFDGMVIKNGEINRLLYALSKQPIFSDAALNLLPIWETMKPRQYRNLKPVKLKIGKSEYIEDCVCDINLDFSSSCPSNTLPDGSFDQNNCCLYCYAGRKQHNPFDMCRYKVSPELIINGLIDFKEHMKKLKEDDFKDHGVIRLGKDSDPGTISIRENFIDALEGILQTGYRPLVITKHLDFDSEIARLLVATKANLSYSIGKDELEPGVCARGCDNEFRFSMAEMYKKAGVDVSFRIVGDASVPPEVAKHKNFSRAIELIESGYKVVFTPFRFYTKECAVEVTGHSYSDLRLLPESRLEEGKYKTGQWSSLPNRLGNPSGQYTAKAIHPYYLNLLSNPNFYICHHTPDNTVYCNQCYFTEKRIIKQGHKINVFKRYYPKRSNKNQRMIAKKRKESKQAEQKYRRTQGELFPSGH
ncbi:hypothetical protein DRJ17_05405 [Candidatus Woesearchaeota archaeon]|nr:MAG: hypothetical protein DRJ17_05405 [Candidatus Woesearchaeota archaeon]